MTPSEACALLAEAGILTAVARHGERVEYRVTAGAECFFPLPEAEPEPLWTAPELAEEPPPRHLYLVR